MNSTTALWHYGGSRSRSTRDDFIASIFPELLRRTPPDEVAQLKEANRALTVRDIELPIAPMAVPAPWFGEVEAKIQNAAPRSDTDVAAPGEALLPGDVAAQAIALFRATSDVLPGEPRVHAGPDGSLVAEFSGRFGRLTSVVGADFLVAFLVVAGQAPIERYIGLHHDMAEARSLLRNLSEQLDTGRHGGMDP